MRLKVGAAVVAAIFILPVLPCMLSQAGEAGQRPGIFLYMEAGTFDPLKDQVPLSDDLKGLDSWGYYIVQFTGPVQEAWKGELVSMGATIFGYIPDHAFIVELDPGMVPAVAGMHFVRWVGTYHPGYKLSPQLRERMGTLELSALFFDDGPALESDVRATGIQVLWTDHIAVRVRADVSMARVLAFMPGVQWVEPMDPVTLLNDNDARILHARQQSDGNFSADGLSLWSYNATRFEGFATGKGVIVAVQDTGVDGNHVDFTNKKVFYKSYLGGAQWTDGQLHGTHVAGTVLGTGQGQAGKYAGIAPDAGLIALQSISGVIAPEGRSAASLKDAQDNGGYICTNSWGDPLVHGDYGSMAIAYDKGVRDCDPQEPGNQSMIVIFAAGNEGFTGIREPATAKNVITVGATGNNVNLDPDQIASFSSNGPTNDGRRKPDIMAPGAKVTSCNAGTTNGYIAEDGTSMAAPGVAGACAVIVQHFKDNNDAAPSPAMVKALLANGADMMSSNYAYPGNGQGWGRVNVQKSLLSNKTYQILSEDQKVALKTGELMVYNASIITTSWPLKVTLAWTDPPGTASASRELVNDLDLELTSPSGQTFFGNNFTNGQSRPGGNPDNINNLEGFYLKLPELGTWTIRVSGKNVPQGPQDYAIAFSGDIDVSLDFIDVLVVAGPTVDPPEPAEGKEVTFNATIRNNGTLPAPGMLYKFTVNDKQVYNFTLTEFKENTTMNISAKWIPTRGKFMVRVELDPQNIIREKNESNNKRLISIEVLFHGLVVVTNAEEMEVNPGAAAVFNMAVKNAGNANDTYNISKVGDGPPPGWKENLTADGVSVRKLSSEQVNFTIWPPANATFGERYRTHIVVTSEGNSSYSQTVNMTVKVRQVFGMNFTTDSPSETRVDPGNNLAFNFTLTNPGNGKDYYTVKSVVVGKSTTWKFGLSRSNFTLGPRGSSNLSLSLEIPQEAFANDTLTLNITATSIQSGSRSYRIKTMVRQLYGTEIMVDGATDRMVPGGELTYRIGLENLGNGNDTLFLKAVGPAGWTASLSRQAAILAPRAESGFDITLQCPPEALAGTYEINISATGSGGNVTYRIINVTVTQIYKVSLGLEPVNRTLTQGEMTDFTLTVGNIGNGNDTFSFSTLNLPGGISASYSPETITLGPGEENTVTVTVTTANTTAAANHTFILKVISQGRPVIYNTTQVALEVRAIPVPPPPPPPPPPGNTGVSGVDIPLMPIIIIVILIGAVGGGAAYAMSWRKSKAWEPTRAAETPRIPVEAVPVTDPLGLSSHNPFPSNYSSTNHREDYADSPSPYTYQPHQVERPDLPPRGPSEMPPSPDTIDTEPHNLTSIKAHCEEDEARADSFHGKIDKFKDDAGAGNSDLQAGDDSNGRETGGSSYSRMGLQDKLAEDRSALDADKKKSAPSEDQNPSGPRFERPDWSADDQALPDHEHPEPRPQYERVEALPPPPPEYMVPPKPSPQPPVTKGTTELDELMNRIKKLSGK